MGDDGAGNGAPGIDMKVARGAIEPRSVEAMRSKGDLRSTMKENVPNMGCGWAKSNWVAGGPQPARRGPARRQEARTSEAPTGHQRVRRLGVRCEDQEFIVAIDPNPDDRDGQVPRALRFAAKLLGGEPKTD